MLCACLVVPRSRTGELLHPEAAVDAHHCTCVSEQIGDWARVEWVHEYIHAHARSLLCVSVRALCEIVEMCKNIFA